MTTPVHPIRDIAILERCHDLSKHVPATAHWLHEQWVLRRNHFADFDHFAAGMQAVALLANKRGETFERTYLLFWGIEADKTAESFGLIKVFQNSPVVP